MSNASSNAHLICIDFPPSNEHLVQRCECATQQTSFKMLHIRRVSGKYISICNYIVSYYCESSAGGKCEFSEFDLFAHFAKQAKQASDRRSSYSSGQI